MVYYRIIFTTFSLYFSHTLIHTSNCNCQKIVEFVRLISFLPFSYIKVSLFLWKVKMDEKGDWKKKWKNIFQLQQLWCIIVFFTFCKRYKVEINLIHLIMILFSLKCKFLPCMYVLVNLLFVFSYIFFFKYIKWKTFFFYAFFYFGNMSDQCLVPPLGLWVRVWQE